MRATQDPPAIAVPDACPWWNLVCQGGEQVADSGLTAITQATAKGLVMLFSGIVKIVDESTQVPLTDETYRDVYGGFVVLAVPVITAVYLIAILAATIRRDPGTLVRATVGVVVATLGGALYVVFAQLLVALDNWLAHGVVAVTGSDFSDQMTEVARSFERMGAGGAVAANMLMLLLMFAALLAGVTLWIVLLLRKIAILVVVVFAPFLIAGWLWAPTRTWARKATETLIALVFCKTVIYVVFAIGMRLLFRGLDQGISDFVGVVVLLFGACFAPLVMLRLVHFAVDSQLAGEMVGTLRAGAQPALNKLKSLHLPTGGERSRQSMADDYSRGGSTNSSVVSGPTGYGAENTQTTVGGNATPGDAVAGSAEAVTTGAAGVAVMVKERADGIVADTKDGLRAPVEQLGDLGDQPRSGGERSHDAPTSAGPDVPHE